MKLTSDFTPICHLLLDFDRKSRLAAKALDLLK